METAWSARLRAAVVRGASFHRREPLPPGWAGACFLATFVVYLAFVPRFVLYSSPPTGDQPFYLMDVISLVQDRDLNVANNYAQRDEDTFYKLAPRPRGFVGMSAPYPLPPQLANVTVRPGGERYGVHPPGLPLLLAPAWALGSWVGLWWPATVAFMAALGALVATNVLLLAHEQTGRPGVALAVWATLGFSSPLMSYSFVIFTELPAGLLLIYAFRRLSLGWRANDPGRLLLVGLCIGYIPWLAWRCAPISLGLMLYAGLQWWRAGQPGREVDAQRRLTGLSLVGGPILVAAVLLAAYHLFLFGSPLPPAEAYDWQGSFRFNWPWAGSRELTRFLTGAFGLLFDRQMGLLPYLPVLALAPVGVLAMLRSGRTADRERLLWLAAVSLPYLFVIAAYPFWNGIWSPPARYLTTFVPLAAAPLAALLAAARRDRLLLGLFVVLAAVGTVLMLTMLWDARRLWPSYSLWSVLPGPLGSQARRLLPVVEPLDELRLPRTLAFAAGGALGLALLGDLLFVRRRLAAWSDRARLSYGLAWAGLGALTAAGWLAVSHDLLGPRTEYVLVDRWELRPRPDEPSGLAYLNERLYLADYRAGALGVLDLASGDYRVLSPRGPGGPERFERPGDVKVGPDGLLYVLNNGPGQRALLVLEADGRLVRGVALEGKTPIATGLAIDPAGLLRVADKYGGGVLTYPLDGGRPLERSTGLERGFSNPVGLAVGGPGALFLAESSARRVHRLDADGGGRRAFELECEPRYLAPRDDWLEVSCGNGLLALHASRGELQRSRYTGLRRGLDAPSGLAYAPDGRLFVVDGATILAFEVHR